MSVFEWFVVFAYGLVTAVAILRHFIYNWSVARMRFLHATDPGVPAPAPKVSVLIPAKDEEKSIANCVRSVLAQDYPSVEVFVVDDRSVDGTAAEVDRLAAADSRVKLVRIADLPPGWTGKTHALHVGQQQATGDWLLFIDADTTYHPRAFSVALADALAHNADLYSIMPAIEAASFWEHVVQPFAGLCLMAMYPLTRVNDPAEADAGFANGQFILVRRKSYDELGGHEAVREKFVEDIHLGRNVRKAGKTLRVVMAPELARVRMYSSLAAIKRGWSRIFYSAFDGQTGKLVAMALLIFLFSVCNYAVLIGSVACWWAGVWPPFMTVMLALGLVHVVAQTTFMMRVYKLVGVRRRWALLRPLAVWAMLAILWETWRMCVNGAVTWRGTTYGRELRQG